MNTYKIEAGKTYNLRGGGTAEILKVGIQHKMRSGETIIGLRTFTNDDQDIGMWFSSGNYHINGREHPYDLLPPEPERVSEWINIYKGRIFGGLAGPFESRELAERYVLRDRTHVLELIYEDGVFVDVIKHKV